MRAKIASRAGGHAFEKRFLELDATQLAVLYRHAMNEEEAERNDKYELIKLLNESWTKKFDTWFERLMLFVNKGMYEQWKDFEKLQDFRSEVTVEEFPALWEELMQSVPQTYVVENQVEDPMQMLPDVEADVENWLAGWVPSQST